MWLIYLGVSSLVFLSGIFIHIVAYKRWSKNKAILDDIKFQAGLNKEDKISVTRAIEGHIQVLNRQRDGIYHLISELEERSQYTPPYQEEKYRELNRDIRQNKEILSGTLDNIYHLEDWYFNTHGRHYMMTNNIQFFNDSERISSKN